MARVRVLVLGCILVMFSGALGFARDSAAPSDKVLAVVAGQEITQQDLDTILKNIPAPFKKAFEKRALYQIIETKVFSEKALKEGLDKSPEFQKRLEEEKKRLLAAFYVDKKIKPKARVSRAEIREYYQRHKSEFVSGEKIKVREWAFKSPDEARETKLALAAGNNAYQSPNSKILWLEKGKLPRDIESAVFGLNKGQISDVVKWKNKYLIFKVIDKKAPGAKSFQDVKDYIYKKLEAEKLKSVKDKYLRKAGVRIIDKAFTP